MVIAIGSYPIGRRFESHRRYQNKQIPQQCGSYRWPRGQAVKTSPFHGGNTSSILVGVTTKKERLFNLSFFVVISCEKGTGAACPRLFARAKRRPAERAPSGVSADTRQKRELIYVKKEVHIISHLPLFFCLFKNFPLFSFSFGWRSLSF